ncbi:efflux transporter outer membrane subunit [Chitinibacter fontanus]|uniref:Efflux transporter outer membrane subunit n=1 Tax=Chitinibacter fontanus TaxID=1737446 RepID=A0A7D5ZDN4_9NEIS|nr:efflux transporter outer membrane subunit [Chitinibacter fontanus]QLI82125.1 efflux transporter outer membrane subunit [Chitinibacter fontanus]
MLKAHTLLSVLLGAGVLLGCAVSTPPSQHELMPLALGQASVPVQWRHEQTPGQFDVKALGFTPDAVLKSLIAEAWLYNTDLRIAASRIEQSRAALKAAGGPLLPSLAIGAQAGDSAIPTSSMSTTGIGLVAAWEIDLWGRLKSEEAAAGARFQASELDLQYSRQAIAAAVTRSWISIIEATQQLELAQQMQRMAEQQVKLIQTGHKVGRNTAQDVALNEATVAVYRNQVASNEQSLNQARRSLEVLLGRYPAAEVVTTSVLPLASSELPAGIPAELMTRRPDVLAAEQRFRAAFQDVEAAQRARLPSLKLSAGFAYIEDSIIVLDPSLKNPLWAMTGQLLAPIFTGGVLEAQIEAKTAKQQEAIAQYSKTALTAFNEVEGALAAERSLLQRQKAVDSQNVQLEKSLGFAQVQQKVGKADAYQLLQQQLSLANSQANLLRVQSERLNNRINLHQALGGHFPE